jgi:hypothetical protein
MGKQVATAVVFKVNGVDLSAYVASVNLSSSTAEVTTTSFGSGGNVERVGGLRDNSVTVSFMQDFVGASVENTIYPLIGGTVACELLPNGTAVGTANPKYTWNALVTDWSPVNGAVGELFTADVTWPITGAVAKATA